MSTMTKSGIVLPPLPQFRPRSEGGRPSLTIGIGALIDPDGSVAWQDEEWMPNGLQDAGEQDMLAVYLTAAANPTKYLALLNDSTIAETDGTMTAVTEMTATGTNGYARQQILTSDWVNDGLISGDYRFSAAEKTFGPVITAPQTADHAALCTTSTGAGLLLAQILLSATTVIAVGQSFKYIIRTTLA